MVSPLPVDLLALAKLLEKQEPKVVVGVGAGVSLGATGLPHASWLGLLKHGIIHLVQQKTFTPEHGAQLEATISKSFSPFRLFAALQYAERVELNLTRPDVAAFGEWLSVVFRDFKVKADRHDTLEAIRDLQQAGALVLTTNYDSLLSDATGLPPVTWEEHVQFAQVMQRRRSGILHIHGHWQRPSSVVLGRTSYNRVVADQIFQDAFKSLWLEWSRVYVGCGDGLDDPNLGRLLEWGKQWGEGASPDYFLVKADKAAEIASRPNKPQNLITVGYSDHQDLPALLHSITPASRCSPFVRIDEELP